MSSAGPGEPLSAPAACDPCLARAWLLGRLSAHLDIARARIHELLECDDEQLVAAVGGAERGALLRDRARFDPDAQRARCAQQGVQLICRCDETGYPAGLRELAAPPAVLHVTGEVQRLRKLAGAPGVAIVGARRCSPYGLENARALGRGVAAAGLTVISGMAQGVDSAAHDGALEGGGPTVAVLPCAPQRPYPPARRALHRRILAGGCVLAELGPDVPVRRWMFPARNRIIAALSAMTVVVAARRGSGALLTARLALHLGRALGAVPGQVTAPLSWGPHQLIRAGAQLVTGTEDILAALFGAEAPAPAAVRPAPDPALQPLLDALADGHDPAHAFATAGLDTERGLAALAALELGGRVRRQPGGRFSVLP